MVYSSVIDILRADACLILIVTGLICAIVRWFHMCHPFDRNEERFYPARRMVSLFYALLILELPYLLSPSDPGVWIYTRLFAILYFPTSFSSLYLKYFKGQHLGHRFNAVCFIGTFVAIFTILIPIIVGKAYLLEVWKPWLFPVCGALGMLLMLRLLYVMRWLNRKIDEYHIQNFSDDGDFPYKFAEKVLWLPLIWITFAWIILLTGSRDIKAFSDILFSVMMVLLLCVILHPRRVAQPSAVLEEYDRIESEEESVMNESLDESLIVEEPDELLYDEQTKHQVLDIILHRFKEKHLQKKDILAEIDKGRIAPASRFIASVGYYNLINMFRLEYTRQYIAANPHVKLSAVAEASGFASGSSFSKAKKSVQIIDKNIVAGVHL